MRWLVSHLTDVEMEPQTCSVQLSTSLNREPKVCERLVREMTSVRLRPGMWKSFTGKRRVTWYFSFNELEMLRESLRMFTAPVLLPRVPYPGRVSFLKSVTSSRGCREDETEWKEWSTEPGTWSFHTRWKYRHRHRRQRRLRHRRHHSCPRISKYHWIPVTNTTTMVPVLISMLHSVVQFGRGFMIRG